MFDSILHRILDKIGRLIVVNSHHRIFSTNINYLISRFEAHEASLAAAPTAPLLPCLVADASASNLYFCSSAYLIAALTST